MIMKKQSPTYHTTDGKLFVELDSARKHQIGLDFDKILSNSKPGSSPGSAGNWSAQSVRQFIIANADAFEHAFLQLAVVDTAPKNGAE